MKIVEIRKEEFISLLSRDEAYDVRLLFTIYDITILEVSSYDYERLRIAVRILK
jgi:hypothetical protein